MSTVAEVIDNVLIILSEDNNYQLCRREKNPISGKFHYSKLQYGDILKLRKNLVSHFGANGK